MSKTSKSSNLTADGRARNFACVVYPESAPSDWLDTIAEAKIPVMVSPFHDKDFNPSRLPNGEPEPKKPHYHVMACFEGNKTIEQARAFFESFGGVGCEVVSSLRGYARYLCHLDNPEKAQYSIDEAKAFGGADFITAIGLPTDKYKAIGEMMDWCVSEDIVSYSELLMYAKACRSDWFRVLCDNGTMVMKEFLKSRKWEIDQAELQHKKDMLESVDSDGVIIDERGVEND